MDVHRKQRGTSRHTGQRRVATASAGLCAAVLLTATACGSGGTASGAGGSGSGSSGSAKNVTVGFIVKTLSNPYFAGMQKAAKAEAKAKGVDLIFEAGKYDGDVATQISDIESLTTRGADAIVIVPNVSSGVVPALQKAKAQGATIIAADTNVDPASAADSFVATDNFKAGTLNGKWAKAALQGKQPVIALLEGTPGSSVNTDRMGGFLKGMGLTKKSAAVDLITHGDQGKAQTAMENALAAHPDINLVWTINEPAALGAAKAVADKGLTGKVLIVSMDGSCRGIDAVKNGVISTDVMQFPSKMSTIAIDEAVQAAQGKKIPQRVDTGEVLVTTHPQDGVSSKDVSFGTQNCWGSAQ